MCPDQKAKRVLKILTESGLSYDEMLAVIENVKTYFKKSKPIQLNLFE